MIKKYFLLALPSIIIISLFYILKPSSVSNEIKALQYENKLLKKQNDSIYVVIKSFEKLKSASDTKIALMEQEEQKQIENLNAVKNKLAKLKDKYEKAHNHSANFSSRDVQRYFADSLDFR